MLPILNKHLNEDDNLESEIRETLEDKKLEEENYDEEIESSSGDNGMPLCAKVSLGLLSAGAVGFTLCKLLSSSNSKDEI